LPIKFSDVIHEAIGAAPPIPDKFKHLQTSALRYEAMPVNTPLVKSFIAKHCD